MDTVPSAHTPMVGRDAELRAMQDVVSTALGSQAQVVALSGQAGVGKSRLARECLVLARARGLLPLVGVGGTLHQDVAYVPLVEALRPLVRQARRPAGPALADDLPELGRLFGELALPDPTDPDLADVGLERTRLFESVCRLLERASARQPLGLLLDDVQWADRGSLALLQYVIRALARRPLLVLLAYRDDEDNPALRDLLVGLRRAELLTEVPLTGLTDEAVRQLAGQLLGGEASTGVMEVLTARSGGVPLFVSALVESLVSTGALDRYDDRWVLAAQPAESAPESVRGLLRSERERLPPDAREVLDLLAVCGAQADHALLERLLPTDQLLRGLAELRARGLVDEAVVDGRVRYRAVHALLCEVAYDLLPLAVRRRRHAAVARAVREHAPDERSLLAQHVLRAGDEVDPAQALDVLLGATDDALARRAGDEAVTDAKAALELAESTSRPGVVPDLLDRLAEGYGLAGDREQAVSSWCTAAHRHHGVDRAERLQRAALLQQEAGHNDECGHLLDQAEDELTQIETPTPVHLAQAMTRMRLAWRSADVDRVNAAIDRLERLGEAMPSAKAKAAVFTGRWQLTFRTGRFVEARENLAALRALPVDLGDARRPLYLRPAAVVELNWGDLQAARSFAEEELRLATRTGVPAYDVMPRMVIGTVQFFAGEWEQTLRRCREMLDLGQRSGLPRGPAMGMAMRGLVLLRRGQPADAAACAERARSTITHQSSADRHTDSFIEALEAAVALARGDADTAAAIALESHRRYTGLPVLALATAAEAQLAAGDPNEALATARTLAAIGPGAPYPAALAAWIRGTVEQDPTLVHRAADELRELGFVYEAAVARLDLAELSDGRVDGIDESLRVLDGLGAQPQVNRARRLQRRHGQPSAAPSRQRRAGELSSREEEVARLVAAGLSNPEIAQQLYLSPRTITTHLHNIYRRLELQSRAALIRYVLKELPPDTTQTRAR